MTKYEPPFTPSLLGKHLAVLGMTGSGKTSTTKLAIEQIVETVPNARVCILDPIKSDHWGLTSSADGKRPGLPFTILGGSHGDVGLPSSAGAAIGELVATGKLPLSILDMSDFEAGGLQRFFVDFSAALLKKNRGVLYLVIEEAHEFAPKERGGFENENKALHYAKKLATAGRSKGIRLIVATQRTQSLHNALLGSCSSLIVHRFNYAADQEPVLKWLKGSVKDKATVAEVDASISTLADGEGWLCADGHVERRQFSRIHTFDNSATPDHDDDQHQVKRAAVDLEALKSLVGNVVDEALANDPRKLKARIAELEKQVGAASARSADDELVGSMQKEIERLRQHCATLEADNRAREQHRDAYAKAFSQLRDAATAAYGAAQHAMEQLRTLPAAPDYPTIPKFSAPVHAPSPRAAALPKVATPAPRSSKANGHADGSLSAGARRCLIATVQRGSVEKRLLRSVTGGAERSISTYVSELRVAGYVADGWPLTATAEGVAALGDYEPLPTGDALFRWWLERLDAGPRRTLELLAQRQRTGLSKAELIEQSGAAERSLSTYISALRVRELVTKSGQKFMASAELFG